MALSSDIKLKKKEESEAVCDMMKIMYYSDDEQPVELIDWLIDWLFV